MNNADRTYLDLVDEILNNGIQKGDRTGTGTISVFGRQIRFNMQEGFPLLTTKEMFTKGVIHELLWFLRGDTNIKTLVENGVHIWDGDAFKKYDSFFGGANLSTKKDFVNAILNKEGFAEKWGELGPIYGKQWVDFGGVNQIQRVMDDLTKNPNSRRIMVNAWNVAELDQMTLPPCHYGFQLYATEIEYSERCRMYKKHCMANMWVEIKDGPKEDDFKRAGIPTHRLSLMWNQRSVDVGLGLPFNIASYAFLLHMFAQQANMMPWELVGSLGDTHIYNNHIDGLSEQLKRYDDSYDLPRLNLHKAQDIFSYEFDDFEISDYVSHPKIVLPLSN